MIRQKKGPKKRCLPLEKRLYPSLNDRGRNLRVVFDENYWKRAKMRRSSCILARRRVAVECLLLIVAISSSLAVARPMDRPLPPPQRTVMLNSDCKRPPPPPPGRSASTILSASDPTPPRPPPESQRSDDEASTKPEPSKQEEDLTDIIKQNAEKDLKDDDLMARRQRPDPPGAEQKEQLLSQIRLHHQLPPRPPQQLHRPPAQYEKRSLMQTHEQSQRPQYAQPQQREPSRQQQQQQQQQQYQHARPLPPQHYQQRPPPRRLPPRNQGSGGVVGIKNIWQQVERGLDGLADLEDAVTDLVTDKAKSFLPWGRSSKPALKALPPPPEKKARSEERRTETGNGFGQSRPASRDEQAKTTGGSVNMYKMYAGDERRPTVTSTIDRVAAKHKIIGSNGGASSRPMDPRQQQQSAQQRPADSEASGPYSRLQDRQRPDSQQEQQGAKRATPFAATAQRRPSIYEGSQQTAKEQPKRPLPRTNPISELNSMPGQRQSSTVTRPAIRPLDDDDERPGILSRFAKLVPPLPRLPFSKLLGRGSNSYRLYADASMDAWRQDEEESRKRNKKGGLFGLFRRNGSVPSEITTSSKVNRNEIPAVTTPVAELLSRSKHGNSTCLLSDQDVRKSRSIGKSRAALDVACLGFLLFGVREMLPYLSKMPTPHSLADIDNLVLPELKRALASSFDSWAWFGFIAAFLASQTNSLLYDYSTGAIASSVGATVEGATEYGQLFLRLVAAIPVEKNIPDYLNFAASSQFVGAASAARLRYFVSIVLSVVVLATVSIVRPVVVEILVAMFDVITLPQLRQWPLQWGEIANGLKKVLVPLGETVWDLVFGEIGSIMQEPMKLAFVCSVLLAVFTMSVLPSIEQRRPVGSAVDVDDDDDEAASSSFGNFDTVANLGTSSASRLDIYAKSGTLEGMLDRWQTMRPEPSQIQTRPPMQSTLRLFGYGAISAVLAAFPLLLYHVLGMSSSLVSPDLVRVDSLVDSSILLLFVLTLTWNAVKKLISVSDTGPTAVNFLSSLDGTVDEVSKSQQASQMNLQMAASISPTKGLTVTDLWAAHTAKRAWAVRGAHLTCRNGEVLVILGDDSAGKSRLLTSISEAIVSPPRRALSTTRVRGSISLGGLDVSKWDRSQLKRRLGLVLNDVRTVSDTAELVSGLTLEEILEPIDGAHNLGEAHVLSRHEKSAIYLALQITGLSATLLPRLPSKLSTVVTANEDELSPSPLRPRCNALSPAEWSKLLLARALTQTIVDNDNPASSDNSPEKSLIGSLLLLDDVTVHMSEVEEAKLIETLRRTGAATLITSHKWATGRFADRIVVVKDGAIVENGTHNELLAKGPQQSIYASKWHAMTTL